MSDNNLKYIYNPLIAALEGDDIDIETVKLLVKNGVDVNAKNDDYNSVLHLAVLGFVNKEVIELII